MKILPVTIVFLLMPFFLAEMVSPAFAENGNPIPSIQSVRQDHHSRT